MRSAEEIILEYVGLVPYEFPHSLVETAINEARKECLLLAASKFEDYEQVTPQIKTDILLLIQELK